MPDDSYRTPPASQRYRGDSGGGGGGGGERHRDEDDGEGAPAAEPMISVLNLIFDHVMAPPSPLEPEEFSDVLAAKATSLRGHDRGGGERSLAADLLGEEAVASERDRGEEGDGEDDRWENDDEEEEILVPVIRIYGPALRGPPVPSASATGGGGRTSGRRRPQSACLHVHGAFPYVLARPVVAGPDGSPWSKKLASRGGSDDDEEEDGTVDWDDPESVRIILDEVHAVLEGAMRAYDSAARGEDDGGGQGDTSSAAAQHRPARKPRRFVRGVSVVVGRGFYTYCPGPPAPFLRIEYYDPKSRWKIKMLLERGLELLPHCHPDPRRYAPHQHGKEEGGGEDAATTEHGWPQQNQGGTNDSAHPLKFRCYEAHIPYSMQFFKDQNLAGMKYVKVGDGRFRGPLPKQSRKWSAQRRNLNKEEGANSDGDESDFCFLVGNVEQNLVWEKPEKQPLAHTVAVNEKSGTSKTEGNEGSSKGENDKTTSSKATESNPDKVVEDEDSGGGQCLANVGNSEKSQQTPSQQAMGESTAQMDSKKAVTRAEEDTQEDVRIDGLLSSEAASPAPSSPEGGVPSQELCILEQSGESLVRAPVEGSDGTSCARGFVLSQPSVRSSATSGDDQPTNKAMCSVAGGGDAGATDGTQASCGGKSVQFASLDPLPSPANGGVQSGALSQSSGGDDIQQSSLSPVFLDMSQGSGNASDVVEEANTSADTETSAGSTDAPTMDLLSQLQELGYDPHWTRKMTSADIELDTTVEQLLNTQDVLTGPQQSLDGDGVHWRAVPSLREIWETERCRMKSLLKPDDDFLSHPPDLSQESETMKRKSDNEFDSVGASNALKTPPFTLSVKKGASVPGSRLAAKGMHRLYDPSPGLEDNHRRAMVDIMRRHEQTVEEADEAIRNETHLGGEDTVSSLLEDIVTKEESIANTEDQALDALNALGGQFDSSCNTCPPSTPADFSLILSQRLSQGLSQTPNTTSAPRRPRVRFTPCTPARFTQADVEDAEEFGRRIDRGEVPHADMDDLIDPATLTPYDDGQTRVNDVLEEEEHMGEEALERSLGLLAARSAADLMDDFDETTHTRTNPTGDTKEVNRSSSVTGGGPAFGHNDYRDRLSDQESDSSSLSVDELGGSHTEGNRAAQTEDVESTELSMSTASTCQVASQSEGCSFLLLQTLRSQQTSSGCTLEPKRKAPLVSSFEDKDATNLHPVTRALGASQKKLSQPWLKMCAKYESFRANFGDARNDVRQTSSDIFGDSFIEPVHRPPTSQQVTAWAMRKRKRSDPSSSVRADEQNRPVQSPCKNNPLKQARGSDGMTPSDSFGSKGSLSSAAAVNLATDEVSRKLSAAPSAKASPSASQKRRKRVAFASDVAASSGGTFQVEEVRWNDDRVDVNDSQQSSQSMNCFSQDSQSQDRSSSEIREKPHLEIGAPGGTTPGSKAIGYRTGLPLQKEKKKNDNSTTDLPCPPSPSHAETPSSVLTNTQVNFLTVNTENEKSTPLDPLSGLGQQGGRLHVEGGGGLKVDTAGASKQLPSTMPTPLTIMSIEVHVQCRIGRAGVHDSREIAMRPDPERDSIFAVSYVHGLDPGGGEAIEVLEQGCILVPVGSDRKNSDRVRVDGNVVIEEFQTERALLLRLASIVQWNDPDALLSWDTQGGGLGYLIERSAALGQDKVGENNGSVSRGVDMVRLLGRTPRSSPSPACNGCNGETHNTDSRAVGSSSLLGGDSTAQEWSGSGLGAEWDERVGAGAAASSVVGRLVLCGWKLVAEEVKHPNASYQPAMVSTVLQKRIPHHDDIVLTRWYGAHGGRQRWRVLEHRLAQCMASLLLFDALDIVGRAGEAARLSGVEFSQSFPGIRGSQYKVEGVLLRALQSVWSDERGQKRGENKLGTTPTQAQQSVKSQSQSPWKLKRSAKTEGGEGNRGYFFFSPSKDDCSRQEALECQALTLEPQSGFHFDPIVVCDFTALYPSLVIAYNLDYSTIYGKLDYHSTRQEMGEEGRTTSSLGPFHYAEHRTASILKHHMKSLADNDSEDDTIDRAYVLPTGSLFVSESVLKGVLPQVLDELLSTRAMIKKAMKQYRRLVPDISPAVLRSLEAKQLALKYVANVTYGYTSATFSGRSAMPLLADAIVECGRRTLTNAITLANKWGEGAKYNGAHVVYGDTDSLFVKLPGRSVKEAFRFGEELCKAVTASNPPPVSLKLEKVYVASLLQTKKKYCGMKYESPNQKKPVFEAKGIETVRRDQCKLTQKVLMNALVTVFRKGIEAAKQYLYRQWALIHAGRLPVADFILTGRVRSKYRGGKIGPVQAALSRRLAEADPGRVVRHKERLPYVIVAAPGLSFRLRDCVLTPIELLEQWDSYTIHAAYYTRKHVNAALQRCLGLSPFNIDINSWYENCPKPRKRIHHWPITRSGGSTMISAYFGSDMCALCGAKCKAKGSSRAAVCADCNQNKVTASYLATMKLTSAQVQANLVADICQKCNGCLENAGTFAVEKIAIASSREARAKKLGLPEDSSVRLSDNATTGGVDTPLANCVCIDCPITYERHKLRENEMESIALCAALGLNIF